MNKFELLVRQTAAQKMIKEVVDRTRADVAVELDPGDRKSVGELGSVTLTKPGRKATLVDRDQLAAYLVGEAEDLPDGVELRHVLDDSRLREVVSVLAEHAPDLLRTELHLAEWVVAEALRLAERGARIPGVEVKDAAPVLQVRPSAELKLEMQHALEGGLVQIEGATHG